MPVHVRVQPEDSPLQVSVLRMCLAHLAPCLIDWGDLTMELGESAAARIARMRSRGGLGPTPVAKSRPIKRRAEKPGELRGVRLLAKLEEATRDPDAALDLRATLATLSEDARAYLELLANEGALPDTTAKKRLDVDAARWDALVANIEARLLL